MNDPLTRRRVIRTASAATAVVLAGCSSGGGSSVGTGGTGGGGIGEGDDQGSNDSGIGDSTVPSLKLLEHRWHETEFSGSVEGTATNPTDETLSYAEVSVTFLDNEGDKLKNGTDHTTQLEGGQDWEFDVPFSGDPERPSSPDFSAVEDYEISTSTSDPV